MRILVLIATDHYVRNFVDTGVFEHLDGHELFYVSSSGRVLHEDARAKLRAAPGYLGDVQDPRPEAEGHYKILRTTLLAAARRRSRTMRHKLSMIPQPRRLFYKLVSLPGVRRLAIGAIKRRTGLNQGLQEIVERVRPDLIMAPSGGYDTLVWDGLRSARDKGIPSLLLIHNWDNLSSKGIFAERPDYLAVWGDQSVQFAERIHGIPAARTRAIGAPSFDVYAGHEPGSGESPFPYPYVLFAGCYAPFDERSALQRLDRLISEHRLDLTIVYRPHPHRHPRSVPDFVEEGSLEHVVIDPQIEPFYQASRAEFESWNTPERARLKPLLPSLDYYPRLLGNAEFIVCPLSTMIVESAILERRVVVVAYDDGIHANSPAAVVDYDHFEGMDRIDGFALSRTPEEMDAAFVEMAAGGLRPNQPLKEQIRWWLYWDERPYGDRLQDWLTEIAKRESLDAGTAPGTVVAPGL